MTSKLSECFWPPLFQTNRISRRINKLSENLTSLSIFTLNIKPFLWKYHILPTLFWAALILLCSKLRRYEPWKVNSPEQNGVFCDCFASFKLAKTFILKLKCSAFIPNISFTKNWKGRYKNGVFVFSVRILVPSGYWATYCNHFFLTPDVQEHSSQLLTLWGLSFFLSDLKHSPLHELIVHVSLQ